MGALPAAGVAAAARVFWKGALWFGDGRGAAAPCRVEGCQRPHFASGHCGLHALQGRYRTVLVPGAGLAAARVSSAPRILVAPAGAPTAARQRGR